MTKSGSRLPWRPSKSRVKGRLGMLLIPLGRIGLGIILRETDTGGMDTEGSTIVAGRAEVTARQTKGMEEVIGMCLEVFLQER